MPLIKLLRFAKYRCRRPDSEDVRSPFICHCCFFLGYPLGDLPGYWNPGDGHWSNRPRRGSWSSQNAGLSGLGRGRWETPTLALGGHGKPVAEVSPSTIAAV